MLDTNDSDQSWLARIPGTSDGGTPEIGSYCEGHEHLNVRNPQPGFNYAWAYRTPDRDNAIRSLMSPRRGYEPVTLDSPEGEGLVAVLTTNGRPTPWDNHVAVRDLVLMRCPAHKQTEHRRRRAAQIAYKIAGPTQSHLSRGAEQNQRLASIAKRSNDDNPYFMDPRHRFEVAHEFGLGAAGGPSEA